MSSGYPLSDSSRNYISYFLAKTLAMSASVDLLSRFSLVQHVFGAQGLFQEIPAFFWRSCV
jgi:hypothetical protein